MFTPVIIGSSGWLARAAQWFFAHNRGIADLPVILGSRESWSSICDAPVHMLGSGSVRNHLVGKRLVVFHLAYLTQEKSSVGQRKYIESIDHINTQVFSLIDKFDVAAVIYASSGAAKSVLGPIEQDDDGKVIYGKLKVRDEKFFGHICDQRDIRFLSPRIYSLAGKFINKPKAYAIADMIIQAAHDDKIVIQARHGVWRSYVDVLDLITVLWRTVVNADDTRNYPAVFDVAHTTEVEMLELAQSVALYFDIQNSAIFRRPIDNSMTDDLYIGNRDVFSAMGADYGVTFADLDTMVASTADYMRSSGLLARV